MLFRVAYKKPCEDQDPITLGTVQTNIKRKVYSIKS